MADAVNTSRAFSLEKEERVTFVIKSLLFGLIKYRVEVSRESIGYLLSIESPVPIKGVQISVCGGKYKYLKVK